jgi:hypothetical protein
MREATLLDPPRWRELAWDRNRKSKEKRHQRLFETLSLTVTLIKCSAKEPRRSDTQSVKAMLGIILILIAMLIALGYSLDCGDDGKRSKSFTHMRAWR